MSDETKIEKDYNSYNKMIERRSKEDIKKIKEKIEKVKNEAEKISEKLDSEIINNQTAKREKS